MYDYNSKERSLLGGYFRADYGVLLHENKLAYEPERSVLLTNGHIEKFPHSGGGFGYRITATGREEFLSAIPPEELPSPEDVELLRGVELKTKLKNETITSKERDELINIALRRVNL